VGQGPMVAVNSGGVNAVQATLGAEQGYKNLISLNKLWNLETRRGD